MTSKPATKRNSLLVTCAGYRQGRPSLNGTAITVRLAYYFANGEQIEADLERNRIQENWRPGSRPASPLPRLPHDEDALQGALVAALRRAGVRWHNYQRGWDAWTSDAWMLNGASLGR